MREAFVENKYTVYVIYRTDDGRRKLKFFSVTEQIFFDVDLLKNTIYTNLNANDLVVDYGPVDKFDFRMIM